MAVLTAQNELVKKEFHILAAFFAFFLLDFHGFGAHTIYFGISTSFLIFLLFAKLQAAYGDKKGTGSTTIAVLFLLCLLRIRNVG